MLKNLPLLCFHLNTTKIIQSLNLADAITDDSYSNVHLASPIDAIHADSCNTSFPLLYSSLNTTKITQSLNLTDAITDDSYSNEHLYSSTGTSHAGSTLKTTRLTRVIYSGIFGEGLETALTVPGDSLWVVNQQNLPFPLGN